jgi:hypothetical protein
MSVEVYQRERMKLTSKDYRYEVGHEIINQRRSIKLTTRNQKLETLAIYRRVFGEL